MQDRADALTIGVRIISGLSRMRPMIESASVMSKYYYTTNEETPAVYHDNQSCEEGMKIEAKNRIDTDYVPSGRRKCEIC